MGRLWMRLASSGGSPGGPRRGCLGLYQKVGKRVLDLVLAIPGLVVLSPVLAVIAVLVRARLGRPVLFRQTRGGLHGEPFELIKFRTMTSDKDAEGQLLPDRERTPPLGTVLRAFSLDELPELWNVVKGDMSLVGPRPFLFEYMPYYDARQRRRHDVRPGMTGLAQIRGRNGLTWHQRFDLDLEYASAVSLRQDLYILARTVFPVLTHRGVDQDAGTTSDRFDGLAPTAGSDR